MYPDFMNTAHRLYDLSAETCYSLLHRPWLGGYEFTAEPTVRISKNVLDDFRRNVGRYAPETGGLLGCSGDPGMVDLCHFDSVSKNTPGSFYYDVDSMSRVFADWEDNGFTTNGIYHSHPRGCSRPSFHDISSALIHMRFFQLNYFYMPIVQPHKTGQFTVLFYIVRLQGDHLQVSLDHIVTARKEDYQYLPHENWSRSYSIQELDCYRAEVDNPCSQEEEQAEIPDSDLAAKSGAAPDYFEKVRSLYPDHVLDKVLVCIGTGGARSFLENMVRSGFRNFLLMDGDTVSPSNIATQGVFISEMGKRKVDVIRDRILDINPAAHVECIYRFLNDEVTDEAFKCLLDRFPDRKPADYLIMGCTDNFLAQKRSAMLALKYGTPYLAAMMYQGGAAAEIIFTYPGVTESCPRCLLRDRFEKYENGYQNDVTSSGCPIFATERMNSTKGYIALMLLMYGEAPGSPFNKMLEQVRDRNFVWIRLTPDLKDRMGIDLFDQILSGPASPFIYMDETLWIPQVPDRPEFGAPACRLCGGTGDLRTLIGKWPDTRLL